MTKAPVKGALPIAHHPNTASEAVLLVHGYTGIPGNWSYFASRLADEGFAFDAPRLPGHGTERVDFRRTDRKDWQRRVLDAWLELKTRYSKIHLAGHSMGGVLSLDLSTREKPASVFLSAPAMRIIGPMVQLTPLLSYVEPLLPRIESNWDPEKENNPDIRALGNEYYQDRDIRGIGQLVRLQRSTRRRLSRITSPVFVMSSNGDKTVPGSVATWLEERLPSIEKKIWILEETDHDLIGGIEKETVADAAIQWFKEH